jgi:hypothetical protein
VNPETNPYIPSVVHHFGPDPATIGGMATVIRVLTEHQVRGDVVDSHPTHWELAASEYPLNPIDPLR